MTSTFLYLVETERKRTYKLHTDCWGLLTDLAAWHSLGISPHNIKWEPHTLECTDQEIIIHLSTYFSVIIYSRTSNELPLSLFQEKVLSKYNVLFITLVVFRMKSCVAWVLLLDPSFHLHRFYHCQVSFHSHKWRGKVWVSAVLDWFNARCNEMRGCQVTLLTWGFCK